MVSVDYANDVLENVESNNAALAESAITIPSALTLQIPGTQLKEQLGGSGFGGPQWQHRATAARNPYEHLPDGISHH